MLLCQTAAITAARSPTPRLTVVTLLACWLVLANPNFMRSARGSITHQTASTPLSAPSEATQCVLAWIIVLGILFFIAAGIYEAWDSPRQERRAAARKLVRRSYTPNAVLIEPLYTQEDLNEDLCRHIDSTGNATRLRERAQALVAKIDRFRAYETVRAAYRAEVQVLGAHLPYRVIAVEVETLLDSSLGRSDVRTRELELLGRMKQLAKYYREHPNAVSESDGSPEQRSAAIEAEVRREARPDDTEDDIQREIAHRRARLYCAQPQVP